MTYLEYELFIKTHFEKQLQKSFKKSIKVEHQKELISSEGLKYKIDLHFKFYIEDSEYLTIIECKNWKSRVTRNILNSFDSIRNSLRAHKAIVVTTNGFQKGAIEFAKTNHIGLYKITSDGKIFNYANYDGMYNDYEIYLGKSDLIVENINLKRGFGIMTSRTSPIDYLMTKYRKDFGALFEEKQKPSNQNQIEILDKIPQYWYDEYLKIETCGLDLCLDSEMEIRNINRLKMLYGSSSA